MFLGWKMSSTLPRPPPPPKSTKSDQRPGKMTQFSLTEKRKRRNEGGKEGKKRGGKEKRKRGRKKEGKK